MTYPAGERRNLESSPDLWDPQAVLFISEAMGLALLAESTEEAPKTGERGANGLPRRQQGLGSRGETEEAFAL